MMRMKRKYVAGGRKEFFGMKASEPEMDLMKRCASHAGCTVSDLVRGLFIEYAHQNGIPVVPGAPLSVDPEVLAKLIGKTPAFVPQELGATAGHLDPDKFNGEVGGYYEGFGISER